MNVAGGLATVIFAITTLTVIGGLFAYGVYKARERSRTRAARAAPRKARALEFFVEFVLSGPEADAISSAAPVSGTASRGAAFWVAVLALVAIAGTMVMFALQRERHAVTPQTVDVRGSEPDGSTPASHPP